MDYIFVSDENLLSDVEILLSDTASRIETCEDVYTSGEVHKPLITAPPPDYVHSVFNSYSSGILYEFYYIDGCYIFLYNEETAPTDCCSMGTVPSL